MYWIVIVCTLLNVGFSIYWLLCFKKFHKEKENAVYTDYRYKNRVLRVYKNEFEYQAIGEVLPTRILETGTLSQFYRWALIEDKK